MICGCKGGGLINGEEVPVHYTRAKDGGVGFGRCGSSYLQLAMDWSVSNGVFMGMGRMHNETPVADRSQRIIGGGYIRAYIRESKVVYCEIFNEFLSNIQLTIQASHH